MSNLLASSRSLFMRTITITLMLGLSLVISVSAAGGTSLGFFDAVKEFFGIETTIASVSPDRVASASAGESKSAAIIEPAAPLVDVTLLAWDMQGNTGAEPTVDSTTTDARLNTSTLSRGAGIDPAILLGSYNASRFSGTTLANAVATDQYMQFTISPISGWAVSLSVIDATFKRT